MGFLNRPDKNIAAAPTRKQYLAKIRKLEAELERANEALEVTENYAEQQYRDALSLKEENARLTKLATDASQLHSDDQEELARLTGELERAGLQNIEKVITLRAQLKCAVDALNKIDDEPNQMTPFQADEILDMDLQAWTIAREALAEIAKLEGENK